MGINTPSTSSGRQAKAAVELPGESKPSDGGQTAAVVQLLGNPATHGLPRGAVERIETHISWVFLTPQHVYKLKKPLRFDFLDYGTRERRRNACEEEVRLNRRLAPGVYVGVEPIVWDESGRLRLGGAGRPLDWVVKMRRLPADRALNRLIEDERLTAHEIQKLSELLTEFYLGLPPVTIRTDLYRARLQHHVEDNYHELSDPRHALPSGLVQRIHNAQQTYLLLFGQRFDDRVCDGRIVEGHGDLRPEHIYLHAGPKVIDCIEFNLEYRQLDVVDELSFLTMECAFLGHESLGDTLLRMYCEASGDRPSEALRGFYASYRASVRAKVAAIRAEQLAGEARLGLIRSARRYLSLADRYAGRLGPPLLLVVRGLSGTGKSTLAEALAERLCLERWQTDVVRRELFGNHPAAGGSEDRRYRPENRERVYQRLGELAEESLGNRRGVVLDGTFLTTESRRRVLELAARCRSIPLVIECRCPEAVARERIEARRQQAVDASDAFPDLVTRQRREEEPSPPDAPVCVLDSTSSLPEMLEQALEHLRRLADQEGPAAG